MERLTDSGLYENYFAQRNAASVEADPSLADSWAGPVADEALEAAVDTQELEENDG